MPVNPDCLNVSATLPVVAFSTGQCRLNHSAETNPEEFPTFNSSHGAIERFNRSGIIKLRTEGGRLVADPPDDIPDSAFF
jgi:hypothetical protein